MQWKPHPNSQLPNKTIFDQPAFHRISTFLLTPQFPSANLNFHNDNNFFLGLRCFAVDDPVLVFSSLLIIFALVDKQYQFWTHANFCLLLETIRSDDKSCSFCEGLQVARLFPIVLVQFVTWPWPWMPTVLKCIKCNFLYCEKCENVRNRTSADARIVFYLQRALESCCTHSTQIDATLATGSEHTNNCTLHGG